MRLRGTNLAILITPRHSSYGIFRTITVVAFLFFVAPSAWAADRVPRIQYTKPETGPYAKVRDTSGGSTITRISPEKVAAMFGGQYVTKPPKFRDANSHAVFWPDQKMKDAINSGIALYDSTELRMFREGPYGKLPNTNFWEVSAWSHAQHRASLLTRDQYESPVYIAQVDNLPHTDRPQVGLFAKRNIAFGEYVGHVLTGSSYTYNDNSIYSFPLEKRTVSRTFHSSMSNELEQYFKDHFDDSSFSLPTWSSSVSVIGEKDRPGRFGRLSWYNEFIFMNSPMNIGEEKALNVTVFGFGWADNHRSLPVVATRAINAHEPIIGGEQSIVPTDQGVSAQDMVPAVMDPADFTNAVDY